MISINPPSYLPGANRPSTSHYPVTNLGSECEKNGPTSMKETVLIITSKSRSNKVDLLKMSREFLEKNRLRYRISDRVPDLIQKFSICNYSLITCFLTFLSVFPVFFSLCRSRIRKVSFTT